MTQCYFGISPALFALKPVSLALGGESAAGIEGASDSIATGAPKLQQSMGAEFACHHFIRCELG